MTKLAVKTEEKAKEIIQKQLEFDGLRFEDGIIEGTESRCECGQTKAVRWTDMLGNSDKLLIVAVCDACGSDDNFADEVLQII
jgi:hypothetical protein